MVCYNTQRMTMSNQWHGGKGSAPRKSNDQKTYADNWDKIFGKKKERAGLNWELEDEQTHTEKAREDFLATREIMKDYPTHRELMEKEGKPQTE